MGTIRERMNGTHIASSGTGAFEFVADTAISKANAVRKVLAMERMDSRDAIVAFDSENDLSLTELEDSLKVVVVSEHTPLKLIEHADIATVGYANLAPVLKHLLWERRTALAM